MKSRIEITAFRRKTVVFGNRRADVSTSDRPSETKRSEPIPDPAKVATANLAEPMLTTVAPSAELTLLIDALLTNNGDDARAATELGLSRNDFLSKLCAFGLTVK